MNAPKEPRDDAQPSPTPKTRATPERGGKKPPFYKPLAKERRSDGFTYRQIAREGSVAIYEQRYDGCLNPSVRYEVIRIRCRDRFQIGDKFIEPYEPYPKSEAWGVDGFTLTEKDAAFAKVRKICNPENAGGISPGAPVS